MLGQTEGQWKMDTYRGKQFLASTPAILKFVQMAVLVIGMVLFLVDNKCWSNGSYLMLYLMPCVVCTVLTLVTLGSGLMVVVGRRNPLTTHAWVKSDVWFNVMAFLVMLMGSLFTFTNTTCSDNSATVAANAMGFIATILFVVSAAIMYLKLRHFQEELMEARQPPQSNCRATISSIT